MSDASPVRNLWFNGALLLFLGLVTGGLVPAFANPRMGLSAHLTAVQCGLVLLAFGCVWTRLRLGAAALRFALMANVVGAYALWLAFVLGAALGTGNATPFAGAGFTGSPLEEALVTSVLYLGVAGSLAGTGLVALGLRPARRHASA